MRIVDLTQDIHNGMWTFPRPWFPKLEVKQMGFFDQVGRNTHSITIGSHHGTHVDAPYHQIADGETIENVSLDILVGPAGMVDFSDVTPGTKITASMLEERIHGNWPERIVFNLGWAKNWNTEAYFHNPPHFAEDAGELIRDHHVKLVGMDTSSPDTHEPGAKKDSPVHKILLGSGVIIVENLCNVDKLGNNPFVLYALPIKVRGSDGSPARCIAIFDE